MVGCADKGRNNKLALTETGSGGRHWVDREGALAVIVTALLAGCGPNMAPIPTKTLAEFTCRTSSEGLEIAVDAWTDADRVKKHFGMDLLSHRMVPFQVAFANVGAEGGFLLQPALATILDERDLQELQSGPSSVVLHQGLHPAVPFVAFTLSPLLAIGLGVIEQEAYQDAKDIRRQIDSVRFNDRPLYRSDSNCGFFYLTFADTSDLSKVAAVKFRVKNIRSKQEKTMVVSLKGR